MSGTHRQPRQPQNSAARSRTFESLNESKRRITVICYLVNHDGTKKCASLLLSSVAAIQVVRGSLLQSRGSDAPTSLANLRGDTVATQTTAAEATTLASYSETDEYGAPAVGVAPGRTATSTPTNAAATPSADSPSWAQGCMIRFFGTNDPILGGGATKYAYPVDPVSPSDVTGQSWFCGVGAIFVTS